MKSIVRYRPVGALIGLALIGLTVQMAHGATIKDQASQLSEQAFALLSTLNAQTSGGSTNPMLGQVASFSSDAETLKRALDSNDAAGAKAAIQSLQSDRVAIDDGLRNNPQALPRDEWKKLVSQLDQLEPDIARLSSAAPRKAFAVAEPSPESVESDASGSGSLPPKVTIASRVTQDGVLRIKGAIEGTALKTAGVYEDGRCIKSFNVSGVPGRQKVDLDIGVADPPPDTVIRVADAEGRVAEAPLHDPAEAFRSPMNGETDTRGPVALGAATEGGVDVFRDSPDRESANESSLDSGTSGVKEIPSHGASPPSPSSRHTLGGKLTGVAITVLAVTPVTGTPPTYEVMGQIQGPGVTRAGIYVNGKLVKTIPVQTGVDYVSFDQRFIMRSGGQPTIRAYGGGNQYVESEVDMSNGLPADSSGDLGPIASAAPIPQMGAPGIGVEITGVRAISANLYAVSGTISGSNIASAGLYQNGVLAQPIALGGLGGGLSIGNVLGSLLPGGAHNYSFNLRYNPVAGFASIRAYDRSGAYTEQPLMGGGVNPYATGAYGASPYGSGPINPYVIGRPPAAPPSRPLW